MPPRVDVPNWAIWILGAFMTMTLALAGSWAQSVDSRINAASANAQNARERLSAAEVELKSANAKLDDIARDVKELVRGRYSVGRPHREEPPE